MDGKRALGLVVGLGGAGWLGWSLFSLLAAAGCAAAMSRACDVPGFPIGLPAGIVLAMVGMFLGGGFLVFSAIFLAIGGAALAIGFLGLMPDMPSFPWLFGGIFFASGLVPLFLAIVLRRRAAAKQVMAEELMRSGTRGIGTITGVGDTGVTINDNPRVVITMRIEPTDGSAPVERRKIVTVSRVQIPRPGERYPAWFDRADPEKWMYATAMDATAPAEVKDMFARARAGSPAEFGAEAGAAAGPGEGAVAELARLSALEGRRPHRRRIRRRQGPAAAPDRALNFRAAARGRTVSRCRYNCPAPRSRSVAAAAARGPVWAAAGSCPRLSPRPAPRRRSAAPACPASRLWPSASSCAGAARRRTSTAGRAIRSAAGSFGGVVPAAYWQRRTGSRLRQSGCWLSESRQSRPPRP